MPRSDAVIDLVQSVKLLEEYRFVRACVTPRTLYLIDLGKAPASYLYGTITRVMGFIVVPATVIAPVAASNQPNGVPWWQAALFVGLFVGAVIGLGQLLVSRSKRKFENTRAEFLDADPETLLTSHPGSLRLGADDVTKTSLSKLTLTLEIKGGKPLNFTFAQGSEGARIAREVLSAKSWPLPA